MRGLGTSRGSARRKVTRSGAIASIFAVALLAAIPALTAGGLAAQAAGDHDDQSQNQTQGQSQDQTQGQSQNQARNRSQNQSQSDEILVLPQLSEAEQLREAVASTEVLIGERLALFSSLASECKECATSLVDATTESAHRLALLGGTWEPWGEQGKTDWAALEFELPGAVVPPPFTVEGTAAYMLATARDQLALIGAADSVVGAGASDLGSLLASRILSALRLGGTFDFSATRALAALPEDTFPHFELDLIPGNAGELPGEKAGRDAEDEGSTPQEADQAALVTFDCVAQTLTSGLRNLDPEDPDYTERRELAVKLQNRTAILAAAGLPDMREPRCQLQDPLDVPQAWLAVVLADTSLLGSEYPGVREAAALWMFGDTLSLGRVAPDTHEADLGLEKAGDE